MVEKNIYTNRLINQKSPYLLQHSHNPVDWYPWGQEAFSTAESQGRAIFLSIGYATCHWCHVMEKESFENPEIARLMNETFINIKVDREELPEVDSLYMEFAQSLMAGSAGWPLNLILTPKRLPFFAATYLPPTNAHGLMGLKELIERVKIVWNGDEKDVLIAEAKELLDIFNRSMHVQGEELPEKTMVEDAADLLLKMADPVYGGLRGAPKFPIGYQYNFLLKCAYYQKEGRALFMVEKTLEMMYRGGIFDHLGGGFSRYSVDEKWLIPHFEKMLYDNALLSDAYLEAWKVTKSPFYKKVCEEILDYVLREMTHPKGGFYSAEDADSEGKEGLFYTWTYSEVCAILGLEEAVLFCLFYGMTQEGNFEGRNVMNISQSMKEFADSHRLDLDVFEKKINSQRHLLWKERQKRIHPFKDDKILAAWNGLMIAALSSAGMAFGEKKYLEAAEKAAHFIESHLVINGRLFRRWREDEAMFRAGLEEYAFLIRGYLLLFEAGCGTLWLEKAVQFAAVLTREFKAEDGAFFQTDGQDPDIIMRKCQFADGAEPSGNALHTENLLKLYQITFYANYRRQAEDVLRAAKKYIEGYPPGYSFHMMNILRYYDKRAPTVIVALNESEDNKQKISEVLFRKSIPHMVIVWKHFDDSRLIALAPALKEYVPLEGKTTLYICDQGGCQLPISDIREIEKSLERVYKV